MKKKVLVTGATKNIGLAISKKFSSEGYEVFGTYKTTSEKDREYFLKEIPGSKLFYVDLCSADSVTELISRIKNYEFDVIVNNAGMLSLLNDGSVRHEFLEFSVKDFTDVVSCNIIATARLSIELKDNIKRGGSIVIISSGACFHGAYATISYNLTKAALINLVESLALNFYTYNRVKVNAISPGWVDSSGGTMATEETDPKMQRIKFVTPMERNAKPEEIAQMVYLYSTDATPFVTGDNILVDGGYKCHNVNYAEEAGGAIFTFLPTGKGRKR